MKNLIIVIVTMLTAIMLVSVTQGANAGRNGYDIKTPYYTTGNANIKYKVIIDNDCWKTLYIRSTPKTHNHILLNFQYTYNNHPTDSERDYVQDGTLKFKTYKVEQATAQDSFDPKIRVYSTWKLTANDGNVYQGTDTQYVDYVKGKTTYELPRPFLLHPDINECRE